MNMLVVLINLLLGVVLSASCQPLLSVVTIGDPQRSSVQRLVQSGRDMNMSVEVIHQDALVTRASTLSLLRTFIEAKSEPEELVLFVDSASLLLNGPKTIADVLEKSGSRILVSAEATNAFIDTEEIGLPEVLPTEKRFPGRSGLLGRVRDMAVALAIPSLSPIEDYHFYMHRLCSNSELMTELSVKLDSSSLLFQNLDAGANNDEVEVEYGELDDGRGDVGGLRNVILQTRPAVVQAASNELELQRLSNYLGMTGWSPEAGCRACSLQQDGQKELHMQEMTMLVRVTQPTPFLPEFLERVAALQHADRTHLLVHVPEVQHKQALTAFLLQHGSKFASARLLEPTAEDNEHQEQELDRPDETLLQGSSRFLAVLDSTAHIKDSAVLARLAHLNLPVVAPLLTRRGMLFSNFWGAVSPTGAYQRSRDYLELVTANRTGLWRVAHINADMLLVRADALAALRLVADCRSWDEVGAALRSMDLAIVLDNRRLDIGHLVDADSVTTHHLHNDLWQIFANPIDWRDKYIHPDYADVAAETTTLDQVLQPCPDVFLWPLLSETAARHIHEEMEFFGQWSSGSNKDTRLEGGYENVPTRDIHMNQVEWEEHWQQVLRTYVYPMQTKLFQGYYDEPSARMNFVVRYKPTEQDRLRPHHDASSYTLNIALNRLGEDYEGGGARFIRYNCSVVKTRVGWALTSPGRITHQHEGLPTTAGTRYIFVTFINP